MLLLKQLLEGDIKELESSKMTAFNKGNIIMILFFLISCKEDLTPLPDKQTSEVSFPNDPRYESITVAIQEEMEQLGAQMEHGPYSSEELLHTAAFGSFEDESSLTPNALFSYWLLNQIDDCSCGASAG